MTTPANSVIPPVDHNQTVNNALHPIVYKTLVGLIVWLVLSIWLLFDGTHYIELIVAMITVFFIVATGIPTLIWMTWRRRAAHPDHPPEETFRLWATQQFRAWSGDLPGSAAAAQILLPIAAVSIGMTVFGLVYYFDVPHLG